MAIRHVQKRIRTCPKSLATMTEATGLGADRFGPRFNKNLPKEGRRLLIFSMNARNKLLGPGRKISPWFACSLRRLKGERPISLLTLRIWSRTRKRHAAEWCDAKARFWDDAVGGSSPLQAALRRLVADERTQHTDNQEACTMSFDVESFTIPFPCPWWHELD